MKKCLTFFCSDGTIKVAIDSCRLTSGSPISRFLNSLPALSARASLLYTTQYTSFCQIKKRWLMRYGGFPLRACCFASLRSRACRFIFSIRSLRSAQHPQFFVFSVETVAGTTDVVSTGACCFGGSLCILSVA